MKPADVAMRAAANELAKRHPITEQEALDALVKCDGVVALAESLISVMLASGRGSIQHGIAAALSASSARQLKNMLTTPDSRYSTAHWVGDKLGIEVRGAALNEVEKLLSVELGEVTQRQADEYNIALVDVVPSGIRVEITWRLKDGEQAGPEEVERLGAELARLAKRGA